jgi:hypothetical protein
MAGSVFVNLPMGYITLRKPCAEVIRGRIRAGGARRESRVPVTWLNEALRGWDVGRTYRLVFATAVALAAIGAPLFMTGAVGLAGGLSNSANTTSLAAHLLVFAGYALPMLLAWVAWGIVRDFEHAFGVHL